MRNILLVPMSFMLMLPLVIGGCSQVDNEVRREVVDLLYTTVNKSTMIVQSDINRIDETITSVAVNILKLEKLELPAKQWIEEQKTMILREHKEGSWYRNVDKEYLKSSLKNDQYALTVIEVWITSIGGDTQKTESSIRVIDLSTNSEYAVHILKDKLEEDLIRYKKERDSLIEAKKQSVIALQNTLEHLEAWKITDYSSDTYSIRGPGLGVPDIGQWTYIRNKSQLTPADPESMELMKILSAGAGY